MNILGIETTCDETGIAVVQNGTKILSNVVASSQNLHQKYGGIVPEVASREQLKVIIPALKESLSTSELEINNIDAVAVANGPGLIGSLLTGVETAKILAYAWNKPLIPVNHLIGHIYANWLEQTTAVDGRQSTIDFPAIALIVSGGHTDLIFMKDHQKYKWLGGTLDDAAGEAFDKIAKLLGLGYPGGPEIEKAASQRSDVKGQMSDIKFPRPMINSKNFDFSFSGLKTAVVNKVSQMSNVKRQRSAIAAEFQNAICDVLVKKSLRAAEKYNAKVIIIGGGVAANSQLRKSFQEIATKNNLKIFFPLKNLSIDNGAMIASAANYNFNPQPIEKVNANPSLYF